MITRFIHTADWQLAKPFGNFPQLLAGELAAARIGIIARVAEIARMEGALHVLVAGDVFDGEMIESVTIRRALEQMRQAAPATWLLLPGNHDSARAGGLWERVARIGLPDNVVVLSEAKPFALSPHAIILPAPLTSKNPGRDPTGWMDQAVTPPGVLRIGLAHGSVHGFGSDGESSVPLARDRAQRSGLAYLALGDWHGTKQIDDRTWYSGTPEPDRFKDNGAGHVLSVSIEGAAPPSVKNISSAHFNWLQIVRAVHSVADVRSIESQVAAYPDAATRLLVDLRLSGALTLPEYAELESWKQGFAGRVRHLEMEHGALALAATSKDLESLDRVAGVEGAQSGVLTAAARQLAAIAQDPSHAQRAAAELALRRLFAFAAEEREAGV